MLSRLGIKSTVTKRSVVIAGRKTSVSLEDGFWLGLKAIATRRRMHLQDLVTEIDENRRTGNLSSTLRCIVLYDTQTALEAAIAGNPRLAHEATQALAAAAAAPYDPRNGARAA